MNFVVDAIRFIFDPGNEVLGKLLAHMGYTALAVGIAAVIALPLGVWLGHTARRGGVVAELGALRALPSLGLLTWLTLAMSLGVRLPIVPATIVLALLAIPPMLAATVSGIQSVPREVVDGARAGGYSPRQVARFVELPLAAPAIVGGVRSAVVQVVATVTVVAYIGLSGLGRFLIDGLAVRDYPQMLAGALVIATLALVLDVALAAVQKAVRPKGSF